MWHLEGGPWSGSDIPCPFIFSSIKSFRMGNRPLNKNAIRLEEVIRQCGWFYLVVYSSRRGKPAASRVFRARCILCGAPATRGPSCLSHTTRVGWDGGKTHGGRTRPYCSLSCGHSFPWGEDTHKHTRTQTHTHTHNKALILIVDIGKTRGKIQDTKMSIQLFYNWAWFMATSNIESCFHWIFAPLWRCMVTSIIESSVQLLLNMNHSV